jgi:hypothetical protein
MFSVRSCLQWPVSGLVLGSIGDAVPGQAMPLAGLLSMHVTPSGVWTNRLAMSFSCMPEVMRTLMSFLKFYHLAAAQDDAPRG